MDRSKAPTAARLHVATVDPFKLKAQRDAARRLERGLDRAKSSAAKSADPLSTPEGKPMLRLVASNASKAAAKVAKPAKTPTLAVVASNASGSTASEPVVTEADFTELPKGAPPPEKELRAFRQRGGGGAGGPPIDGIFNQDDVAGVLIVLALLLLIALYLVSSGTAPPEPQKLASAASVEPAPPAPLVDPFGDRPVDLTPRSPPPPPPAAEAAPAPAPACPPGRVMRVWFCTAQSGLSAASRAALENELADWSSCLSGKQLVVTGYADTRGNPEYNVALSAARAKTVAELLNAKGVKVSDASGAGELSGLEDNQNCANQRRVDVRLSDEPEVPPSQECAPPPDKFAAPSCGVAPRPASAEPAPGDGQ